MDRDHELCTKAVHRRLGFRRNVLPCRKEHGPAAILALWCDDFCRRNSSRVIFRLPVAQSITRFQLKVKAVRTRRADYALTTILHTFRREAIDPHVAVRHDEMSWSADAVEACKSDSVFMLPMQQVIRHGAADDGWTVGRSSRFEIHSPAAVNAASDRRRQHSQRHMRHGKLRRDSNAGLWIEQQAIVGEGTQDISLTRSVRLRGSDGRVENPVATSGHTHGAWTFNSSSGRDPCTREPGSFRQRCVAVIEIGQFTRGKLRLYRKPGRQVRTDLVFSSCLALSFHRDIHALDRWSWMAVV